MPKLILMRHAKSDWSFSEPDHDRPLNDRGTRSAQVLGQWLRDNGPLPDQALVSSARRTQDTFDLLRLDTPKTTLRRLYHAEPEAMLDALHDATGETVLMIGHNPGIAELAALLVKDAPKHAKFGQYPTGATLIVDFDRPWNATRPGTGRALDFIVPRELLATQ